MKTIAALLLAVALCACGHAENQQPCNCPPQQRACDCPPMTEPCLDCPPADALACGHGCGCLCTTNNDQPTA